MKRRRSEAEPADDIRAEALALAVESLRPHGDTGIILARAAAFEVFLRRGASGSGQPSGTAAGDGPALSGQDAGPADGTRDRTEIAG